MAKYEIWWQGVGEIMIGTLEAKSHKEVRRLVYSQIVIRKKPKRC